MTFLNQSIAYINRHIQFKEQNQNINVYVCDDALTYIYIRSFQCCAAVDFSSVDKIITINRVYEKLKLHYTCSSEAIGIWRMKMRETVEL